MRVTSETLSEEGARIYCVPSSEIVNVSDEVLTKLYTEITQKQMEE